MPQTAIASELFRIHDLSATAARSHGQGLLDLHEGRADGFLIRSVFSPAEIATVLGRLGKGAVTFPRFNYPWGFVYGKVLFGSNPDLPLYLEEARQFRSACQDLFANLPDFEVTIERIFESMSGGLPVEVPVTPQGEAYTPATIRYMNGGHELAIHCGRQFLHVLPGIPQHKLMVDDDGQLSYFVMLDPPEAGGELVLYNLSWSSTDKGVLQGNRPDLRAVADSPQKRILMGRGDMVIFNGGRIWHSVARVEGSRPRITIGGFLGYDAAHTSLYYWS